MEFRPYYLAREWQKRGHQVQIVGASFSHLRKIQPNPGKDIIDGIQYYWIKTNSYKGNGIFRILSILLFIIKVGVLKNKIVKEFCPDIVISSSTYPLSIYPTRMISKKAKAKICVEVNDLWPLSPMEIGGYSKWNPFIIILQIAENYSYRIADSVVSLLPFAKEHMVNHGLAEDKFFYIPNGYSKEDWRNPKDLPLEIDIMISSLKNKGMKLLGYLGGHAKSNSLDSLLDAMKIIKRDNITCLLIGNGTEKNRLRQRVSNESIQNVIFIDPIVKSSIPQLLAKMDFLYIGWSNSPLYRFGISPTKLSEYMISAKPIIHSVNAPNDLVKEVNCGISIAAEDPVAISSAIETLASLPNDELIKMGLRGKEYAEKNLEYGILAVKFNRVIEQ
jgi:glycosyltransferase involved in cell wall biosynthesis